MDMRAGLSIGSRLDFINHEGGRVSYLIRGEAGRGGSSIVYNATYTTNLGDDRVVRIKECYPFGLRIAREESGALVPAADDAEAFLRQQEQLKQAFLRNNRLFAVEALTNSVSNTVDLYEANGTCYIVSTYMGGETLADHRCRDLRECIAIVLSTARAVEQLHRSGCLYLDLKPDNIFVIRGTTELVQLFDFDSVLSLEEAPDSTTARISYTRGFAALEQQAGSGRRLGFYTDVYGLGAVLFFELFGRVPTALDCDAYARYDFSRMRFPSADYPDRLLHGLADFFHQTLIPFAPARLQSMSRAAELLADLMRDADPLVPCLLSTRLPEPKYCYGREDETHRLQQLAEASRIINVTGLGGIGKSTLVLRWLSLHRQEYDATLYLSWSGSAQSLITDDARLTLNTVSRLREETAEEYYARKLRRLREHLKQQRVLLVLDNLAPEDVNALKDILSLDWQPVLISRQPLPGFSASLLPVAEMREADLFDVFESNLQAEIPYRQEEAVSSIIRRTGYHTLAVELLAKQIYAGFLSIEEAEGLIASSGTISAMSESVDYEKDQSLQHAEMAAILDSLLKADHLPEEALHALKLLSLFGPDGIDASAFRHLAGLKSMDGVDQLVGSGWVTSRADRLLLHPVMADFVGTWPWSSSQRQVEQLMENLYRLIRQAGGSHTASQPLYPDVERQTPENYQHLLSALRLAERVLTAYPEKCGIRQRLMYHLAMDLPLDQEERMLRYTEELLAAPEYLDPGSLLRLCGEAALLLGRMECYPEAYAMLDRMRQLLHQHPSAYYTSLLAQANAILLYNESTSHATAAIDRKCLRLLDRAIGAARLSRHPDGKKQLASCLLSKATTLMNMPEPPVARCYQVMTEAIRLVTRHTTDYDEVRYQCFCSASQFFAVFRDDKASALRYLAVANHIADTGRDSDLGWVDHVWEEEAPLFREMGMYREAYDAIADALTLCENHADAAPYQRARRELMDVLDTIGQAAGRSGDADLANEIEEKLNQEAEEPET